MIAIACAKGGSGKTTTTLGLAAAFARAGEQSLAVDADRQLPDLHVTAGVTRAQTIADVDGGGDWRTTARRLPNVDDAYVLPGAESGDVIDLQSTLEGLRRESTRVLVDCPSGSGPDVIDPLAAADGVVVATPPTNRGVDAARKTVDVARQLDVPVLGVVVTKCEQAVEDVDVDLQAPVLSTVPECESPLSDGRAASAYDAAVAAIVEIEDDTPETEAAGTESEDSPDASDVRVEAGEGVLSSFGPGTVVALHAPPASQSESLLYGATSVRGTLYLTAERSEALVKDAIDETAVETGSPTIRSLDEDPLAEADSLVEQLPANSNLVVDSVTSLERAGRAEYRQFLNALSEHIKEMGGLAVLHCLEPAADPQMRALTDQFADVVLLVDPGDDGLIANGTLNLAKRRTTGGGF
ncbi:AAA family ATPase [Halorubellus sp. JP-L1]|uniref:DUF7125 family protein n=1 Tax=Halorubellus sp. JP-L1 TaxID=2715753 RepID=UPI00140AC593|nr:AAA family ATPase [Halorubellus sp. JP-L1]NHN40945.1 AAA family ATPase [Halorubellus sp. JP-L1]